MEYSKTFTIDGKLFKAIEHKIDEKDVLHVLCKPIGKQRRRHPAWFDVTYLPDNVCEFYYSISKKVAV
jgi:hypothetical protein